MFLAKGTKFSYVGLDALSSYAFNYTLPTRDDNNNFIRGHFRATTI